MVLVAAMIVPCFSRQQRTILPKRKGDGKKSLKIGNASETSH
jgi:hypothetical protein